MVSSCYFSFSFAQTLRVNSFVLLQQILRQNFRIGTVCTHKKKRQQRAAAVVAAHQRMAHHFARVYSEAHLWRTTARGRKVDE